ncbi:MAG: hypothetical protein L6R40_008396 [Gallowayella cf. fulva]|nr:MAG: hypothetical protein L6R40_008396 [Xanthomendoza cf. fulva]
MAYRGSHHRRYGPYPSQSRGRRDWDDSFPRGNPYQFNTSHGNFSWLDGRSKSGPTDKDIEILRSIKAKPTSRALECSPEEAFTLAQEALENVRKRIHCINSSRADVKSQSKYLLPFRVFNELDKEFFRSMLKGNVSLGWTPLAWGVLSLTKCAGQNDNPRTRIELSPLLHLHGTRLDIFAALIHQMVHAYYLQCCGHRESAHSGDGHDLGHEQQFHALLRCIAKHCDPLRDILMASLWVPRLRRDSVSVQRYCSRGSSNGAAPGTCSCYSHGARFNEVDIRDWRNIALAKAKSLQEARESSETGVGKDDK